MSPSSFSVGTTIAIAGRGASGASGRLRRRDSTTSASGYPNTDSHNTAAPARNNSRTMNVPMEEIGERYPAPCRLSTALVAQGHERIGAGGGEGRGQRGPHRDHPQQQE